MNDSCLPGPNFCPECGKKLEFYANRCKPKEKNHRKINKLQIECRFSALFEHFTFK